MGIFDIANISSRQTAYIVRDERIKREGSETFVYKHDTLTAGSSIFVDVGIQWPASRKFEPLDFLELTNNDSVDIEITINQQDTWLIPAGIIKTFKGRPVWTYKLTNLDSSTDVTSGKVRAILKKEAVTIDKWARGVRV